MTVIGRKPGGGRYSLEQRQEDRSEGQLKDRFAEFGWPTNRFQRDLGEDLILGVYDDGTSTGLSFHVQLKSTANSATLKLKRSDTLAYDLEVKDLLHWEKSTTLVVLVLWDVVMRTGWWRPIPEIIDALESANEEWRNKGEVAVHVPLANSTDDAGLSELWSVIADHNLPLVPKPDVGCSLAFPNTEEGGAGRQMLDRALDVGEAVTFKEGFLPNLEFPSWHRRIYGSAGPGDLLEVTITPTSDRVVKPLRIEVVSTEGLCLAALSRVELRLAVPGRKRRVWNNEHQKPSIVFSVIEDDGLRLQFRRVGPGENLYEAREAVGFLLACAVPASVIRVNSLEDGKVVATCPTASATVNYDAVAMSEWREVLDKLMFIQRRVPGSGSVSMAAFGEMTREDVDAIDTVFQILREGKVDAKRAISLDVTPSEEEFPDVDCDVQFDVKGPPVEVLGLSISLGDVRTIVVDSKRCMAVLRTAQLQANATGEKIPVRVEDVRVIEEYLDWLPSHLSWAAMYEALDPLAEAAAQREGYFTRADARAAGAGDAVFDALLTEHKIEPIAADIYHLVQFPRSDQEEHLILWLQTDRQGVLSHETALLLHELSDILPQRLHITVPPGFDPGSRQIDPTVELLRGDVADDEKCWLGPVPYTSALRTLRECIDIGVSPDLNEQAIEQGLERGLFTEDQLPVALPAKSA